MKKSVLYLATTTSLMFVMVFALFSFLSFKFSLSSVNAADCASSGTSGQDFINDFNKCGIQNNKYDDKYFNFNQISGTVDSLNTMLLGGSQLHPETNALSKPQSALAMTSSLVAGLYVNPPASGVQYFASEIQKLNPVQPTYAAGPTGIGYDALKPVQKLWTVFRNASYVGFILVFIIIGFMVMFRAHISSQAVATVQDSIPRIVIALFLVTFSYAIAGLMIDFMFVIINVLIYLLSQAGVINQTQASDIVFNKSIIGVIIGSWRELYATAANAIKDILDNALDISFGVPIAGSLVDGALKFGVGGIGGLVVGIAAIFIMFRIFLMLLMAYVTIILMTLAAPFYFLIQALPGNNGAKDWFKQMGANIAVFPMVSLMVLLAGIIGGIGALGGTSAGELTQVGTEAAKFPLLVGGINANAVGKIIAIGILFMTPSAAEMVKTALGVKGGPNFGGAIMGGLAAGGAAGKQIAGEVAPHTPYVGNALDRFAAGREMPKIRRQATIAQVASKDYDLPPGYKKKTRS